MIGNGNKTWKQKMRPTVQHCGDLRQWFQKYQNQRTREEFVVISGLLLTPNAPFFTCSAIRSSAGSTLVSKQCWTDIAVVRCFFPQVSLFPLCFFLLLLCSCTMDSLKPRACSFSASLQSLTLSGDQLSASLLKQTLWPTDLMLPWQPEGS